MEKSVLMDRVVHMHIQESNNYIRLRHTKKSFVLIFQIILGNVNMVYIVHSLIAKNKYKFNLFIIIHMIKIFICFTIKLNFVRLI